MNKKTKEVLDICNEFLQVPSVSSYEKPFLHYLNRKIKKLGYSTILKRCYLAVNPESNSEYLFSAHIDRNGIIRNFNNEFEYSTFLLRKKNQMPFRREDADFYKLNSLRFVKDTVISYDTVSGKKIRKYKILRSDFNHHKNLVTYQFDKTPKKEENVFMLESKITQDNKLFFGQIDNVISAAVLYYILKNNKFQHQIIFTTKEEYGKSWESVFDYLNTEKKVEKINNIVVLDTSPYPNFDDKEDGFLVLRKGDEFSLFNKELVNYIDSFLRKNEVKLDYKNHEEGRTELGRIISESNNSFSGTTLQLPTMNYHTTFETSTLQCLNNYIKIIEHLNKKNG